MNAPIPDGRYDAFVVDVRARDDENVVTLTITTGEQKGSIVDVTTTDLHDELALIGLPCTLVVEHESPRVEW